MALSLAEGNKYSNTRLKVANQKKSRKPKMPMKAPGMGEAGMKKMKQITPAEMAKMGC